MAIYKEDKRSDIERILFELKEDLFDKTLSDERLRSLADKFAEAAIFLTCRGKEEIKLGYVAIYCNDNINKRAYISMIVVKKDYQYKGIGTKLLEEAIKTAQKERMETIVLKVAKDNIKAQNFYRKHGFWQINEMGNSYLMGKVISKSKQ